MNTEEELTQRRQDIVRSHGMCGERINEDRDFCALQPGHPEPHPPPYEQLQEIAALAFQLFFTYLVESGEIHRLLSWRQMVDFLEVVTETTFRRVAAEKWDGLASYEQEPWYAVARKAREWLIRAD